MLKCEICEEEARHIMRCEEHYRCDDCGTREDGLCFYGKRLGGLLCDACKEKRVQAQIAAFSGRTRGLDHIVCPWCGYEPSDVWEFESGGHSCENCGRDYELEIVNDPRFSTAKA